MRLHKGQWNWDVASGIRIGNVPFFQSVVMRTHTQRHGTGVIHLLGIGTNASWLNFTTLKTKFGNYGPALAPIELSANTVFKAKQCFQPPYTMAFFS